MLAIFRKEINAFFGSPMAYVVIVAFLVAVGLIVWVFPSTNVLDYGYADLGAFFTLTPYLLLFLIPAITMRSIADEVRSGMMELLLTKPLSLGELVMGKFWATMALLVVLLAPTGLYALSIYQLGNPVGNIDTAAVLGGYLGLLLLGSVFVAIGIWASSLHQNQIVAFVIGVFGGFVGYIGLSAVVALFGSSPLASWLSWLALDEQYEALGRGLLDTRNIFYLLSLTAAFLALTHWQLARKYS